MAHPLRHLRKVIIGMKKPSHCDYIVLRVSRSKTHCALIVATMFQSSIVRLKCRSRIDSRGNPEKNGNSNKMRSIESYEKLESNTSLHILTCHSSD